MRQSAKVAEVEHIRVAPASNFGAAILSQEISKRGTHPDSFVDHEVGHRNQDTEGTGWFGIIIYRTDSGFEYILGAFYELEGARDPEARMRIASGPGFLAMSHQDWFIYHDAKRELSIILQRQPSEQQNKNDLAARDPNISRIPELQPQTPYEELPLAV